MTWLNPCTSLDQVVGRRHTVSVGIKPRAYWRDVAGGGQVLTENDSALALVDNKLVARGPLTFAMFPTLQAGRPLYGLAAGGARIGLEPLGINARTGSNYTDGVGNVIGRQWANAWANADLRVYWAHHKAEKEIGLKVGHPTQFDWKVWDRDGDLDDNLDLRVLGKWLIGARRPYLYNPADPDAPSVPVTIQKREVAGDLYIRMTLPPGDWTGWMLDPTWSVRPGAADGNDNYIQSGTPTANSGTSTFMSIGEASTQASVYYRGLIQFSLADIPSGAVLSLVTLDLWLAQAGTYRASSNAVISAFRQNRAWVEIQSTWNIWSTGNNWATAGGFGVADCEQVAVGSGNFATTDAQYAAKSLTFSPTTVAALDLGNGWLLKPDAELDDRYDCCSSDHATAAYRPMLTVVYSLPLGGGAGRGRSPILARGGW